MRNRLFASLAVQDWVRADSGTLFRRMSIASFVTSKIRNADNQAPGIAFEGRMGLDLAIHIVSFDPTVQIAGVVDESRNES